MALIGGGVRGLELRHQHVQLGLGLPAREAPFQPPDADVHGATHVGELRRRGPAAGFGHHRHRHPQVGAGQSYALEAGLGHADDDELAIVESQRAVDHRRIGAQASGPEAMGEDHHGALAGHEVFIGPEEAAEGRTRAEDVEEVCRDQVAEDPFARSAEQQAHWPASELHSGQPFEAGGVGAEVLEGGMGHVVEAAAVVTAADVDHLSGIDDSSRRGQQRIGDADGGAARGDAEAQGKDRRGGEQRASAHQPQGEAEVGEEGHARIRLGRHH